MGTIEKIIIGVAGAIILFIVVILIRMRYYKKLVEVQDEICLQLLSEAGENNRMMKAMGLVSPEDFEKQKDRLLEYTDLLIKGGYLGIYLHEKKIKEGK